MYQNLHECYVFVTDEELGLLIDYFQFCTIDFDVGGPYTNPACLRDGIPCAPNGDGGCVACDFVAQ